MSKKTSAIALTLLILAAVVFGFILINRGDGPVTGMIISNKAVENIEGYKDMEKSHTQGVYLVMASEFNKFNEKYSTRIPANKDLYFSIHAVECPKGSQFTAKWLSNGKVLKEETKAILTDKSDIISYLLEENIAAPGSYSFELYYENRKVMEKGFKIE